MGSHQPLWLLLPLGGCVFAIGDRGMTWTAMLDVDPEVAASFDETSPGVLVTDLLGEPAPLATLCGQRLAPSLEVFYSELGCFKTWEPETVTAWVQPLPRAAADRTDTDWCSAELAVSDDEE